MLQLVEASSDLVCVCDNGCVKYMNRAGLDILGATDFAELDGRPITDFTHRDYQEILTGMFDSSVEEKDPLPMKFVNLSGGEFDAEAIVQRVPGAAKETAIFRATDITETIRSAERMRSREELLQGIMETVAEGIVTLTKGARFCPSTGRPNVFSAMRQVRQSAIIWVCSWEMGPARRLISSSRLCQIHRKK